MQELERFHESVLAAFAGLEEVVEIFEFGSLVEGGYDRYSDVDMHVVTWDFEWTMARLDETLRRVGPVLVQYPLSVREGYVAYMIVFENYPFYNKVDISILDPNATILFPGYVSVLRKEVGVERRLSELVVTKIEKGQERSLYGHVLGAIRYAKYRKRGKHFSAYKFYRAQLDAYLMRVYREVTGESEPEKLGPLEYRVIDRVAEVRGLERLLYQVNETVVDRLYVELLREELEEAREWLVDEEYAKLERIVEFVQCELGVK